MKSSLVTVWCVVLGLTGVLPAARLCAVAPAAQVAGQDTGPLDEAAVERAITSGTSGLPPLDLETLRGGAGEEFFVRVEGTGYTKDFKIKRKHLDRLYQ